MTLESKRCPRLRLAPQVSDREFARTGEFEAQPAERPRAIKGGTSMAHKTHRWAVRSLQQQIDLQHLQITWHCEIRGCHQLVVYTHTFRKPPRQLGAGRGKKLGGLEVDWRSY